MYMLWFDLLIDCKTYRQYSSHVTAVYDLKFKRKPVALHNIHSRKQGCKPLGLTLKHIINRFGLLIDQLKFTVIFYINLHFKEINNTKIYII